MADLNNTDNKLNRTPQDISRTKQTIDLNSRDPVNIQGPKKKSFCKDPKESIFKPTIEIDDIKNVRLRHIFKNELAELKQSLEEYRDEKVTSVQEFKYEVMLCFWFAIHTEAVAEAQLIYKIDPIIESIMQNLRTEGDIIIQLKRNDDLKRANKQRVRMNDYLESCEEDECSEHSHDEDEECEDQESNQNQEGSQKNQEAEKDSIADTPNIKDLNDLKEIQYILLRPKPSH